MSHGRSYGNPPPYNPHLGNDDSDDERSHVAHPHNGYLHDEYEDHHGDDDSDHEDELGEHHHDSHDAHHHHHQTLTTREGLAVAVNLYHHDPKHGVGDYHFHQVTMTSPGGTQRKYKVMHQGREHHNEPAGSALALLVNKTPIVNPERISMVPMEPVSSPIRAIPLSQNRSNFYNAQQNQRRRELQQSLVQENKEEENCCSCTIS